MPSCLTSSTFRRPFRVCGIRGNAAYESAIDALGLESLPIVRPTPGQKVVPIKTQARSATILPNFVGLKFQVHNGKVYHDVTITEDMVGHKLGEFSPSVTTFSQGVIVHTDESKNKEEVYLQAEQE
ncbi:mitochondrial ribosomal small subunit component [Xylographa soralifera]|nr:mitochondrial ribosomal small subunit component [Xylographa soralifera]